MPNVFNFLLLGFVLNSSHAFLIGVRSPCLLGFKPTLVYSLPSKCGDIKDGHSVLLTVHAATCIKLNPYRAMRPQNRFSLSSCHATRDGTNPSKEEKQKLAITSTSNAEDTPLSPYAWFVAILLLVVNIHSQWTRALVYYLVSFKAPDNADSARLYMNKDLGFGEEQYAVLASFGFTALFTVFSLIAGRAADKLNRAQVVAAGAAAWSFASIAQATATSFDSILDLRALTGVSQAFLNPQVNRIRCLPLNQRCRFDITNFRKLHCRVGSIQKRVEREESVCCQHHAQAACCVLRAA
jgi:hypothetical protein